ncbi:MAG: glycogen-binding domain-containing protein [Deltaproteobacteria bacterium]|nr:glycogen-binding domain-containing protein [Deltaproteobacteria bacterium]MBW2053204.1 glycogen-binding domain-containing protein [Deltaproteobacteria bacterium]MBW2142370.1 glycogen-binding domain-containing protein [Deltaproteobacteria bacterium]
MQNKTLENKSKEKPEEFSGLSEAEAHDLHIISRVISDIPEEKPPVELMAGVMQSIKPKSLSLRKRFMRWLKAPQSLTFTPLQAVPFGAAAAVLILAVLFLPAQFINRDTETQVAMETPVSASPVIFSLNLPGASSVAVIGSFNQWTPRGYEMRWDEKRKAWTLATSLEKGRHAYAFLVDGQLVVPDPQAVLQQDDGFGNKNSILILSNGDTYEKKI